MCDYSAQLTNALNDFIQHYRTFCTETFEHVTGKRPEPMTLEDAIDRINGGDCGTAAIAVSHVVNTIIREEHPTGPIGLVGLWDNYNHAYMCYDGRFYDTIDPNGKASHAEMLEADAPNRKEEQLDLATLFQRYILRDRIGAMLIRSFCIRYRVTEPYPVTALLHNGPVPDKFFQEWLQYVHATLEHCEEFRPEPVLETDPAEPIEIEGPLDPDPSADIIAEVAKY